MFSYKIKNLFLELFELIFAASYSAKEQKILFLKKSAGKLDLLKFFLQTMWEAKSIDNKKYIVLSKHLAEIGKMLGGWTKQFVK